jgi:hypothetical protein
LTLWGADAVARRPLENASSDGDIKPLALFIAEEMGFCPVFDRKYT